MLTKTLLRTVSTHREQLIKAIEQSGLLIVREVHGLFKNNEDFVFPHIILTLTLKGSARAMYDMRVITHKKNDLAIIMPGHIMHPIDCTDDFVYAVLFISPKMFDDLRFHTFSHDYEKFNYAPICSLTDEQAADILCPRVPEHLRDVARKLIALWDRPIIEIEGIYPLIEGLKSQGYGIYLLSNASCRQPDYWQRVPAAKFFDGTLISYSVKLIKPMLEIYEKFFETFGLRREECFFIDDSPANIEAGLYVGMPGVVFHNDIKRLRRQLRAAGVMVKEG